MDNESRQVVLGLRVEEVVPEVVLGLRVDETTTMTSPIVSTKAKVVKNRGARIGSSTTREKSHWEHVDEQFPDCQVSQSKPSSSSQKGARIGKWIPSQNSQVTNPLMKKMPSFMQPYIDDIVDVVGDGYCGYRVVSLDQGKSEDDYELVKLNMIREIKLHKSLYEKVFGSKDRVEYILDALHPDTKKRTKHGVAPLDKWLTFPDMGHVIATYYKKVVVELTKPSIGISETFFPLRESPPQDPSSQIVCLGLIPNHFVYVKLKPNCPLPKTSETWRQYCSEEAVPWEYPFMDRQKEFEELMEIEKSNVVRKKKKIVGVGSSKDIPLACDSESD